MSEPSSLLHEPPSERRKNLVLNGINREFYTTFAEPFSRTRTVPWRGWRRVLGHFGARSARTPSDLVLVGDIGCGNGRFGAHAARVVGRAFRYVGVDASPELLGAARSRLRDLPDTELVLHDLVTAPLSDPLPLGKLDDASLLVAFGILHHLPGRARRLALLASLSRCLRPGGLLAVCFWRFDERLRPRVLPAIEIEERLGMAISELEPGDVLLRWGSSGSAIRYCHFAEPSEVTELILATGLERIDHYASDGPSGESNVYFVLGR